MSQSKSRFRRLTAYVFTAVVGVGKIVQGAGSGIFGAMQGGGAFAQPVNAALGDTAAVAGGMVTAATRIPKLLRWAKDIFGRCNCLKKPKKENGDTEAAASAAQPDEDVPLIPGVRAERLPQRCQNYFLPKEIADLSWWRRVLYAISKPIFVLSGFSSLGSTTLIAFQSGALLINRVFNLIGQPLPLWAEILWSVFVAMCTGFMYFTFNVLRILPRSHDLANTLARLGINSEPRSTREKIALAVTAPLALSFSGGMFGYSIISTHSAIEKFMSIFFPGITPATELYKKISIVSATPSILSTLLTGSADLYDIFTGKMKLRKIFADTACKSFWRGLGFGLLFLAGVADVFCGNWLGFWGGLTSLFNTLGWEDISASWFAGIIATLSAASYWGNNGGHGLFEQPKAQISNAALIGGVGLMAQKRQAQQEAPTPDFINHVGYNDAPVIAV